MLPAMGGTGRCQGSSCCPVRGSTCRTLMTSDAALVNGIPCTTGARTIIDCAMEMTVDELRSSSSTRASADS